MKNLLSVIICIFVFISGIAYAHDDNFDEQRKAEMLDSLLSEISSVDISVNHALRRVYLDKDDTFDYIAGMVLKPYFDSIITDNKKLAYAYIVPGANYSDMIVYLVSTEESCPFRISGDTICDAIGYLQHDNLYIILDRSFNDRIVQKDDSITVFNLKLWKNPSFDERIEFWFRQDSISVTVNMNYPKYWQDERTIERISNCLRGMESFVF